MFELPFKGEGNNKPAMQDTILSTLTEASEEALFMQAITHLERALDIVGSHLAEEEQASWETVRLIAAVKQRLIEEYAASQQETLYLWKKTVDEKEKGIQS
ncbi:MAG: hypothetical protein NUV98_06825 [Candidatus Roizmanbacteria bacterium]|nr:hypothetical protein [Candidatus Roizmanbacteria bacterium]